jgi:hypothetical protein
MKTLSTATVLLLALCGAAFAQDNAEAARQQRMDAAYAAHHDGRAEDRSTHDAANSGSHGGSSGSVRQDARNARHAIHQGARDAGHAIHKGLRATGHAIHDGAKATGHAIHKGVDKVTGK